MFNRKRLSADARVLTLPSRIAEPISEVIDHIAGRTLAVPEQRPLRYPRSGEAFQVDSIFDGLRSLPSDVQVAIALELLLQPQEVFTLTLEREARLRERRIVTAVLSKTANTDEQSSMAIARVLAKMQVGAKSEFTAVSSLSVEIESLTDTEKQDAALEDLFRCTEPGSRRIRHVAAQPHLALWIGGSAEQVEDLPGDWRQKIAAVAAVRGLDIQILQRPMASLRQVLAQLRSAAPDLLVMWEPYLGGTGDAICEAFHRQNENGHVIANSEAQFVDALIQLRWDLDEFVDDWQAPPAPVVAYPPPVSGEIRFYRKHHGSKVGDKMLRLREECGHNKWGSTSSAPLALKGIEWLEHPASPGQLFRCAKCGDWKARF
jgi:hypothetical protein